MNPSHGAPFRGFRDDEESPFFCAAGRTPEETWDVSVDGVARLLFGLGPLADAGPIELSPALLCAWHREIFGELFGKDAGRLRGRHEGNWEHVQYGAYVGTRRSRRIRPYRGAHPRRLHRRLEKICKEFNTAAAEIRASPATDSFDVVEVATRLYVKLLRAHPFIDGNLRAITIALNAGLVMFGLDIVVFKDLERHDELLGIAFVGKHDPYRPLAEHITEIVGDSESV
jgi:fido (protein-threonine AMPylation protein)